MDEREWQRQREESIVAGLVSQYRHLAEEIRAHDVRSGTAADWIEELSDRITPSHPPGATQTPSPGVGMGEGEKVAQEGREEAREVEERVASLEKELASAVALALMAAREEQAFSPSLEERVEALEDLVEDLGGSVDALQVRLPRNEDIAAFAEKQIRDRYNATAMAILNHRFAADEEKLGEFESPGVGATYRLRPYPDPPVEIHVPYNDPYCPASKPCSPAPPPCAEPAEETSSGGEGCGEGTAGGACCSWMAMAKKRHWATVGEESGCTFLCLYDEDDSVGPDHDEVISFCPWCGSPLREDGELRVGGGDEGRPRDPDLLELSPSTIAVALAGKTIDSVEYGSYLHWPMTLEKIYFTDGSHIELEGNADCARIEEYVGSSGRSYGIKFPEEQDGELRVGDRPLSPEEYEAAREALAPELTLDETGCIQPAGETSNSRKNGDTLEGGEG